MYQQQHVQDIYSNTIYWSIVGLVSITGWLVGGMGRVFVCSLCILFSHFLVLFIGCLVWTYFLPFIIYFLSFVQSLHWTLSIYMVFVIILTLCPFLVTLSITPFHLLQQSCSWGVECLCEGSKRKVFLLCVCTSLSLCIESLTILLQLSRWIVLSFLYFQYIFYILFFINKCIQDIYFKNIENLILICPNLI